MKFGFIVVQKEKSKCFTIWNKENSKCFTIWNEGESSIHKLHLLYKNKCD